MSGKTCLEAVHVAALCAAPLRAAGAKTRGVTMDIPIIWTIIRNVGKTVL